MDLQLSGKTALVTGASRGIGRVIALGLAREIVSAHGAEPLIIASELYREIGAASASRTSWRTWPYSCPRLARATSPVPTLLSMER